MAKKMFIDAAHPEEVRVVILDGNKLEEYDYETTSKKQLKGNIYLAKVTRVEPSLQAAFVDYGGNRQGFLAFSEIHPDYYRIPVADRSTQDTDPESPHDETEEKKFYIQETHTTEQSTLIETSLENQTESSSQEEQIASSSEQHDFEQAPQEEHTQTYPQKRYRIQEVIKKRQILLVQVTKEERGNKGAALTTYLSLPGRYCVLMPNTDKDGGGISRKIHDPQDRRKLREVIEGLETSEGMSIIVRTAGSGRSKSEIKRDFESLNRLWDNIRNQTLHSIAPSLVYEEGDLLRRAIRDLYSRDIDEIIVEGEEGYKSAKQFMRLLIPSHSKKVQLYKDKTIPLFYRYHIEEQLASIDSPVVQLPSGGYIVINQTEALVAIDVNSGRSTKERNIEETALKTNLEAAEEVARQLRLRDLGGLIVIDFIDMSDHSNQHAVEKRLKDAVKHDRARIQIGRISQFGLLEMSRQRLRPSVLEASSQACSHCGGIGTIRSVEARALQVLRAIEAEALKVANQELQVILPAPVAFYILNEKRNILSRIETQYHQKIVFVPEDLPPYEFSINRTRLITPPIPAQVIAEVEEHGIPQQKLPEEITEISDLPSEIPEPSSSIEKSRERGKRPLGKQRRGRKIEDRRFRKPKLPRPGETTKQFFDLTEEPYENFGPHFEKLETELLLTEEVVTSDQTPTQPPLQEETGVSRRRFPRGNRRLAQKDRRPQNRERPPRKPLAKVEFISVAQYDEPAPQEELRKERSSDSSQANEKHIPKDKSQIAQILESPEKPKKGWWRKV